MCILGYIALEIGTSASLAETSARRMMQSWALGKPIRCAEYFRPLHKLKRNGARMGSVVVEKTEKYCAHTAMSTCHSNFQFSQQPLIAIEPRFDFPDRINTIKHRQRPKSFSRANRRRRIWIGICSGNLHSWIFWEPTSTKYSYCIKFHLHNSVFPKDQNGM